MKIVPSSIMIHISADLFRSGKIRDLMLLDNTWICPCYITTYHQYYYLHVLLDALGLNQCEYTKKVVKQADSCVHTKVTYTAVRKVPARLLQVYNQ